LKLLIAETVLQAGI